MVFNFERFENQLKETWGGSRTGYACMLGPATRNIGPKYPQVPHGNTTWLKYWKGPVCSGKGLTGTVFSERSFLNMNGELVHSQNLENGTCVFNDNYQHLNKLIDWDGRISLRIFCILNIKK